MPDTLEPATRPAPGTDMSIAAFEFSVSHGHLSQIFGLAASLVYASPQCTG